MIGMREESFGPICFVHTFRSAEEVIRLAQDSTYGLHATIWGWQDVPKVVRALAGSSYLEEVESFVFGKFGMLTVNSDIPFAIKELHGLKNGSPLPPFGGYGYSGWVWENLDGRFVMKQGPKAFELECSVPVSKLSGSLRPSRRGPCIKGKGRTAKGSRGR
jgi:acyl-CoA reductase-like NAD-dependent aldehyde dehydrogenase